MVHHVVVILHLCITSYFSKNPMYLVVVSSYFLEPFGLCFPAYVEKSRVAKIAFHGAVCKELVVQEQLSRKSSYFL